MSDVTSSNKYSETWNQVKALLKNNIVDPKHRFKIEIVHSVRQLPGNTGFCGYPYVVVTPTKVSFISRPNDNTKVREDFSNLVQVIGTDNPELDSLSNQVYDILTKNSNWDSLRTSGLKNPKLGDEGGSIDYIDGKRVFVRSFNLTYEGCMRRS